jgi:hypothetical protein
VASASASDADGRGEPDAARAVARHALAPAGTVGEDTARGLARDVLASIEQRWGDTREAARLAVEALALYRAENYREGEASALHLTGRIALGASRCDEARAAMHAALHLCGRGDRAGMAEALEGLAEVAVKADAPDEAAARRAEAARLRAETGIPRLADDESVISRRLARERRLAATSTGLGEFL